MIPVIFTSLVNSSKMVFLILSLKRGMARSTDGCVMIKIAAILGIVLVFIYMLYDASSEQFMETKNTTCYEECNDIHNAWVGISTTGLPSVRAARRQCQRQCNVMENLALILTSITEARAKQFEENKINQSV